MKKRLTQLLLGASILLTSSCTQVQPSLTQSAPTQINSIQEQISPEFFACNFWKDYDADGRKDYPQEFMGIKNKFSSNEQINLVSHGAGLAGEKLGLKILDASKKIVYENEFRVNYDHRNILTSEQNLMEILTNHENYGKFKAVWYMKNQEKGSCEFEIEFKPKKEYWMDAESNNSREENYQRDSNKKGMEKRRGMRQKF